MIGRTKIFLDSSDAEEARKLLVLLGAFEGQTTNPSLVAKHPAVVATLGGGHKYTRAEIDNFYKTAIEDIEALLPDGDISVEVYADHDTTAAQMYEEGSEKATWGKNIFIKYPTTEAGLAAAEQSVQAGLRVNMTLCFTQEQAAAVYAATKGAPPGSVVVSPFVGRLDDQGECGVDLIKNIMRMYAAGDGHVAVLAASIRNVDHLQQLLAHEVDIVTSPLSVYEAFAAKDDGEADIEPDASPTPIPYEEISLDNGWDTYDIEHPLTRTGIDRFADDWNELLEPISN